MIVPAPCATIYKPGSPTDGYCATLNINMVRGWLGVVHVRALHVFDPERTKNRGQFWLFANALHTCLNSITFALLSRLCACDFRADVWQPALRVVRSILWLCDKLQLPAQVLVALVASQSIVASGLVWIPTPAIGYLRADCAIAVLFLGAATYVALQRVARGLPLMLIASSLVVLHLAPAVTPRYYVQPLSAAVPKGDGARVVPVRGVLSQLDAANLVSAVFKQRAKWTKVTSSEALGYFIFGDNLNFDRAGDPTPYLNASAWSASYGFPALQLAGRCGSESAFILHPDCEAGRVARAAAVSEAKVWFSEPLRAALALAVDSPTWQIVLGGEGEAVALGHPAVHVYLRSVLWGSLTNPHQDHVYTRETPRGFEPGGNQTCDDATRTSVLIPLTAPRGTGLLWWARGARGVRVEREVLYEVGNAYKWPPGLTHAVRPWPYAELAQARVTIQAFGVQCAGIWYFYH